MCNPHNWVQDLISINDRERLPRDKISQQREKTDEIDPASH